MLNTLTLQTSNNEAIKAARAAAQEAARLTQLALKGKGNCLPTIRDMPQAAQSAFGMPLGNGLSRVAFLSSKGTVAKAPLSANGHIENLYESYLLPRLASLGVACRILGRSNAGCMPVLEMEKLERVSAWYGDNRAAMGEDRWLELVLVGRLGLGLTDWLQTGYSASRGAWVLSDVANPDGLERTQLHIIERQIIRDLRGEY